MARILRFHDRDEDRLLGECAETLAGGSLVILPTDTVYGLAARVDRREAVERIFRVKGRNTAKALVVMVSDVEAAAALVDPAERSGLLRLSVFWPGPLTLVVRAALQAWLEWVAPGSSTLGIRIPNHPFLLRLLEMTGPLAVTSANPSGKEAPADFAEIDPSLLEGVELAVDQGRIGSGKPSTVAELREEGIKILRGGEIGKEELEEALRPTKGGTQ